MKQVVLIIFFTLSLFALDVSNSLEKEAKQLIDSFECFSKEDKTILSTYTLALKYRMQNVDNKKNLIKSDLDYWRVLSLVYDIQSKCALNDFDNILEDTITPTLESKNTLKKLRRIEGSIHTDGSSESSERMRKYDAKLKKKIITNPPKYTILQKNKLLHDYDLKSFKHYTNNSIPQYIYTEIEQMNLKGIEKDLLLRYALLKELRIRMYDKPKQREKINQELLYLQACQKDFDIYLRENFYKTFKRKLLNNIVSYNHYYPVKSEFLPNEIKEYCENNITSSKLTTFIVKKESAQISKIEKKEIKLENLQKFLEQYNSVEGKKAYAKEYFSLMKSELEKSSTNTPSMEALKLLRLQDCLVDNEDKKEFELIMSRVKDFRIEGIKEIFYKNIFNSQVWWKSTIKMKIDAEGENKELKQFFDCNQTSNKLYKSTPQTQEVKHNMRKASSLRDEILKYYASTFEGKATPNLNNAKAIEAGLISKKMLDKNGKIKVPLGSKFTISGMPKGGVNLSYEGVPKGKICSEFIMYGKSSNDVIFFNSKSYKGLDYILLNGVKIKMKHYSQKYVDKLCSQQESNTISFIIEDTIRKHTYDFNTKLDNIYNNTIKVKALDSNKHSPSSFAYAKDTLVVIGEKAKHYSLKYKALVQKLSNSINNSYNIALSSDANKLALTKYDKTYIWNLQNKKMDEEIAKNTQNIGSVVMYLNDDETLLVATEKLHFIDTKSKKIIAEIKPKFMKISKGFRSTRITSFALSPNKDILYIGSNVNKIERWEIKSNIFTGFKVEYLDTIQDGEIREFGALAFDPNNEDILVAASRNKKINFWNIKDKKVIKTLDTGAYTNTKEIHFSDNSKYMITTGHEVHIWNLNTNEQVDIINGDKVLGAIFLANSLEFIVIAKEVSLWKIKDTQD